MTLDAQSSFGARLLSCAVNRGTGCNDRATAPPSSGAMCCGGRARLERTGPWPAGPLPQGPAFRPRLLGQFQVPAF